MIKKLNLVFIFSDQQRADTMSCYGNDRIETPVFNALGEAAVNPAMSTPWRSIVSADRWRLNLSAHDQCELYDLNADPFKMISLFDSPKQQSRIATMTERIRRWQERTEDRSPLPPLIP